VWWGTGIRSGYIHYGYSKFSRCFCQMLANDVLIPLSRFKSYHGYNALFAQSAIICLCAIYFVAHHS
jgi:hypothetical protein